MSHLERLLLTFIIIFISLGLGYWCKHAAGKGQIAINSQSLDKLRRKLQNWAIFLLLPGSAMLSLWGLPKPSPELLALPLLGVASYVAGGFMAILAAKLLKLDRKQTGSFYCCGTFTNIGAVGGLTCLLFLGENSIALVAIYRLLEEVYYFGVSFPIARWYGAENGGQPFALRNFRINPVLGIILFALLAGIGLNLAGIERPHYLGNLASAGMLMATIFFLFAIGLTLKLSRITCYLRAGLCMCAIKFLAAPVVITGLAALIGFGAVDQGLPLQVVAIVSAMPVAMTALVPPAMFGLDVDLANACWIITTLGLMIQLPLLMLVMPLL